MSRRCVFLDRDGVINVKPRDGHYVTSWDEFVWIPETTAWIRLFNALDYLVVVVTNQRGVARGRMSIETVDAIHAQMVSELADQGAVIDDVLVCPHELDSCDCRKPRPGMVFAARDKWAIEVSQSIMIGDSGSDRQLAETCGMKFVHVLDGKILAVVPAREQCPNSSIRGASRVGD